MIGPGPVDRMDLRKRSLLVSSLFLLAACTGTERPVPPIGGSATRIWTNARTGETIVVSGGAVRANGAVHALRDCSTPNQLCVESDGLLNLVVNASCGASLPPEAGDRRTRIWMAVHETQILRDERSPQVLFEYAHRHGVVAIYYSAEGLGMTEAAGPDPSAMDASRFVQTSGPPFMACR